MGFLMMLDPLYWLLLGPTMILAVWAQIKVKSAFSKYKRVGNARGISGAEAAARILRQNGMSDVGIDMSRGQLSDHYDPRSRMLRLSPEVYQGRSIAAVGIAAHEAGHALQHAHGYALLGVRNWIVPLAGFGSWLAFPLIIGGFLLSGLAPHFGIWLAQAGVIVFGAVVAFQLVTLPVEFNASSRAKQALADYGIIVNQQEKQGVDNVLGAAAMTYVAATITALAQLLYFMIRTGMLGGDE